MIMTDNTFSKTTSLEEVGAGFKASHCGGGLRGASNYVKNVHVQEV